MTYLEDALDGIFTSLADRKAKGLFLPPSNLQGPSTDLCRLNVELQRWRNVVTSETPFEEWRRGLELKE